MNSMKLLAATACAVVALLATGCNAPVKITGGGKAIGTAVYDSAMGKEIVENVPATAACQAILDEPYYVVLPDSVVQNGEPELIGYTGRGNLQFVDHVTGQCFHAKLMFGGADPGDYPEELDPLKIGFALGYVRDCLSMDEAFDDGEVEVAIYDDDANGPDKGDGIMVMRFGYDDEGNMSYIYTYVGYLESGNYKVRPLSSE